MSYGDVGDDGRLTSTGRRDVLSHIELMVASLQAKMETFISTQTIRDEGITRDIKYIRESQTTRFTDHETRLRAIELRSQVNPVDVKELFDRIHVLEQKRYVEPKTVWTAFALLLTVGGLVVAIINLAIK